MVIPTYYRPVALSRCLTAILRQAYVPEEVVVVMPLQTSDDSSTLRREWRQAKPEVRVVLVERPGLAAALAAGVAATTADIVAVTDDDAVPRPDWLARLLGQYGAGVGGVGGRDALGGRDYSQRGREPSVGRVTGVGRCIGNHHLGAGRPREVDVLKGVNMSLRRELWKFDYELAGRGAQVHSEMHLCLRARRLGFRLIYDPDAVVDHYPAVRPAGDDRMQRTSDDVACAAYNQSMALFAYSASRGQLMERWAYRVLVGDAASPGLLRAAYGVFHGDSTWRDIVPAQRGVWKALCRTGGRVKALPET